MYVVSRKPPYLSQSPTLLQQERHPRTVQICACSQQPRANAQREHTEANGSTQMASRLTQERWGNRQVYRRKCGAGCFLPAVEVDLTSARRIFLREGMMRADPIHCSSIQL